MVRVTIISALGLITAVAASAGSIEIGGPTGLTSNYITQGAGAVCAAGPGACVTGSTGGWAEKNYNNVLFATATNGTTPPVPFSGYTQTGGEAPGLTAISAGDTTSASGITFAMISDGAASNNASKNLWEASAANTTITIPIGVFDVTDVGTMVQNAWGTVNGNDTDITFNFGSSSNATTGLTSITFDLLNSNNVNPPGASGEIRASVDCLTVTTSTCNLTTSPQFVPLQTVSLEASDSNFYTVNTAYVFGAKATFGGQYAYTTGAVGMYAGSQGFLKLDDQDFVFGSAFANDWLVSVGVTQNSTFGMNVSASALSAITVDAAPEPTTILLVLSGLASLGVLRRFRKA